MALFAIGDLHLSFGVDKPMDVFGDAWREHPQRLIEGFAKVGPGDLTVLAGDLSWGISLAEALEDFRFVERLPGRKLILKGNHDYWWDTAAKIKRFFQENQITSIELLHNNAYLYGDTAIAGTRGWFLEEGEQQGQNGKIYHRELCRLEASLKAAEAFNARQIFCFLHYPPLYQNYECEEITDMLADYRVKVCCFGHLHGKSHRLAVTGVHKTVDYRLISADFLGFQPIEL